MRLDRAIDGFWLARRRELSRATQADYGITFRRLVDLLGPECAFEGITAEDVTSELKFKTAVTLSSGWRLSKLTSGVPLALGPTLGTS